VSKLRFRCGAQVDFNATAMDSLHIPMAVLRMRLGHADVSITDGYTNAVERDDEEAAEKIPKVNN
jgi:hypothetical protein